MSIVSVGVMVRYCLVILPSHGPFIVVIAVMIVVFQEVVVR